MELILVDLILWGDALVKFLRVDEVLAVKLSCRGARVACRGAVVNRTREFRRVFPQSARKLYWEDAFTQWRWYVTTHNLLVEAAYNLENANLVLEYVRGNSTSTASYRSFRGWMQRVRSCTKSLFITQTTRCELQSCKIGYRNNLERALVWKAVAQRILSLGYCCDFCSNERITRLVKFSNTLRVTNIT